VSADLDGLVAAWGERGRPLTVPGASTRVWSAGELLGDAPVLCLHGVPTSAFLYRKVLDELAGRGLHGIAVDLPGLGFADRPADFDYSWSGLAAWAHDCLDALGHERVHLVVHDIGGPVGFDLIRRAPDRIASLLVLNTIVSVERFRRPWVMAPFAIPVVGEAYLRATPRPAFVELMRRVGVATDVPRAELAAHHALLRRGDGGRAFLAIMRSFERTAPFERGIREALAARRFPAAVAWGMRDRLLPAATHGADAVAALGLDRLHELHASHLVPEDAPGEVAELVADLVREASRATAVPVG
jgi:pimeloyl-ACP methyl ester carboxylesterase